MAKEILPDNHFWHDVCTCLVVQDPDRQHLMMGQEFDDSQSGANVTYSKIIIIIICDMSFRFGGCEEEYIC